MADEEGNVLPPLAEGLHLYLNHIDTVIEIFAEASFGYHGGQIVKGRHDKAHVHVNGGCAADTLYLSVLQYPQKLCLQVRRQGAQIIQEERSPVSLLYAAAPDGRRTGGRRRFRAKELLFQRGWLRRAVNNNKGIVLARRCQVNGPGNHLLACSGLACNQDSGAPRSYALHHLAHLVHILASANQRLHAVMLLHGFLQKAVLPVGPGQLDGIVNGQEQLVVGKRLGDVVKGAVLHGFHSTFYGAEGSHDKHRDVRPFLLDPGQHLHAAHPWHLHVRDNHVHFAFLQKSQCRFRIA